MRNYREKYGRMASTRLTRALAVHLIPATPSIMFKQLKTLSALAIVLLALSSVTQAKHPNIVIILVDDMGYGDAGCYNPNSKIPTPNIDRLAKEGMRFTDAHSSGPLCHPSRYGLMTGTFPFRTDVNVWRKKPVIRNNEMTIGKLLQSVGYKTAMVGKWHLGFAENGYENPLPGGPFNRGFDSFYGIRASTDIPPYFYIKNDKAVMPPTNSIVANKSEGWTPIQGAFWRAGGVSPDMDLNDVLPRFTQEAVKVIAGHDAEERPLMLYLAYPAPHTPWLPEKQFIGKSGASMYGDFLVMVDTMIGHVLNALDKKGMKEDTLVIFSSDNGPVWYDSDVERFDHDSSGGLRGMKGDAWEGGHRMPFIARWPEHVKAGSVNDRTISFVDTLATFADLVDKELPKDAGLDSFSYLPALEGESATARGPLILKSANGTMSIQSGDWKLIEGLGSGGFTKPSRIKPTDGGPVGQLYHLKSDPGETEDLYLVETDIVKRLQDELADAKNVGRTRR